MANFDTLKATIAARIPDNIDQLITAEDVRQSFLDTIDEINAAKEDDGAVAPAVWGGISGDIADQTDLQTALGGKQATLVSGTNIKTINNESLLGSGNIVIQGGGGASVWGQITGDLGDQTDLKNALDGKADKVTGAISGHLAGLDANGDLTDSGSKASDFATATQGAKADTAVQPGSLAAVATSGDYDDLLYKPSIPAAPGTLNTDNSTAQTTSSSEALSGAVKLHKVSKTGSYNDLLNKPTIPAAQVQADWNEADNTKADYIKNKPTIPTVPTISTDIDTDKASNDKTASPKAVYDFVGNPIVSVSVPNPYDGTVVFTQRNGDTITVDLTHTHSQYALKELVETSQPLDGMAPNTLYILGIISGAVTFAFAAPTDNTIVNEYMLTFDSGTPAAVPTWPNSITSWVGNCISGGVPLISAGKHYEVSVIGAYGTITEY